MSALSSFASHLLLAARLQYQAQLVAGQILVRVDTGSHTGIDRDPGLSRFTYMRGDILSDDVVERI